MSGRSYIFNRAVRVNGYVLAYLRYQLGLRGRPSLPAVSQETLTAARALVDALLKEKP